MLSRPRYDDDGLPIGYRLRSECEIAPRTLESWMSSDARRPLLLVDIRLPEEREVAVIEPSEFVPMHEIESSLDDLQEDLDEVGPDAKLVLYCHHGIRSLRVTLALQAHGFTQALSLAGGIDGWSVAIDQAVPRYDRSGARCVPLPPA